MKLFILVLSLVMIESKYNSYPARGWNDTYSFWFMIKDDFPGCYISGQSWLSPDSVKAVCQQVSQWIGYSDDNPVLTNLYNLAIEELTIWHNNYRPVSKDYVYMS